MCNARSYKPIFTGYLSLRSRKNDPVQADKAVLLVAISQTVREILIYRRYARQPEEVLVFRALENQKISVDHTKMITTARGGNTWQCDCNDSPTAKFHSVHSKVAVSKRNSDIGVQLSSASRSPSATQVIRHKKNKKGHPKAVNLKGQLTFSIHRNIHP